ncbi:hypothetical protein AJ79_07059 [Helicocarpus griseus UAMH5409]|uniref:MYND-type domain-containing protein n=1 Tax=Helicocarpus griseus UAMH5409 TaxID=1447875 RepID=A0A2B7X6Y3_9EURO|nr:hypothetical protein AJ79_07059 [Helicocarpus griseus UAMH5409]
MERKGQTKHQRMAVWQCLELTSRICRLKKIRKRSCIICTQPGSKACTGCHAFKYCSIECQETDWPAHKLVCRSFKIVSARPEPPSIDGFVNSKRAILFPVDAKEPQFFWVKCEWMKEPDSGLFVENHELETYYPGEEKRLRTNLRFNQNPLREKNLDNGFQIWISDSDGLEANQSIMATTKGKNLSREWRGNVVVTSYSEASNVPPTVPADMTMSDFRAAVDIFTTYGVDMSKERTGKCKGVKIRCFGEEKEAKRTTGKWSPKYEPIGLPVDHPIFAATVSPSPVSRFIRIPVLTRKCKVKDAWKATLGDTDNQAGTYLHIEADPKAPTGGPNGGLGWGMAPAPWQNNVGSVFVVRADGKDLLPTHLWALYGAISTDRVMARMTREGFEKYFEEFKKEMVQAGQQQFAGEISPYAI